MKNKNKMQQRKINTGIQHRTLSVTRSDINEEERTVPIAFSSEAPVKRWWGTEILSHDESAVNLGRLKSGGALLVDHDMTDHIGVVKDVSIDSDKKGRAVVKFGRSTRAEEIFQDVLDGIRQNISVGYSIEEMTEDRKTDTFTATRWTPHEISIVSIPADVNVGVGRSESDSYETTVNYFEERIMDKKEEKTVDLAAEQRNEDLRKQEHEKAIREAEENTRKAEMQRIKEISALGAEHNMPELAESAISQGLTVDKMRSNVLDTLKDTKPTETLEIGLTPKEVKRFSMARAIYALSQPNNPAAQEAAKFELECSHAVAEKRGVDPQGFFVPEMTGHGFVNRSEAGIYTPGISVPHEVQHRADLNATTDAEGGYNVATNLLASSFIDVLRNNSVLANAGATILSDLTGDVAIPAKLAAGSSAWLATEGASAVQSDMTFRQVTLTPKTAATYTEVTRQLLLQSSVDIDNLIRNDIAAGMAILLDLAGIYGTGANGQPTGIVNTAGIGDPTTWAGADPTWAEVVDLETNISTSNALAGSIRMLMDSAMRGALKTTEKATGTAQFIMGETGMVNGYPTTVSEQMTDGDILMGNFADLLIGLWGGLDILVDPYGAQGLAGTVRVVAHQSIDVAVRHAESFALGNDTI